MYHFSLLERLVAADISDYLGFDLDCLMEYEQKEIIKEFWETKLTSNSN